MNSMNFLERKISSKEEKVNKRTNKTSNVEEKLAKKLRVFFLNKIEIEIL